MDPKDAIFVPSVPEPPREPSGGSGGCLHLALIAVLLLGLGVAAMVGAVQLIARHLAGSTFLGPNFMQGFQINMFRNGVGAPFELMWGIDRAQENVRRLEWIAQSIREYQALRGAPPPDLSVLRISQGERLDAFGVPIEYRVTGQPPQWEIRSAGRDRTFDDQDPWFAGP